jgi:hypothetical protein
MAANPMHQRLQNLRTAPRCGAKTRRGRACMSPAVKGRARCRMHGGAKGSGAPCGEGHGHYRHGFWAKDQTAARRAAASLLKHARQT